MLTAAVLFLACTQAPLPQEARPVPCRACKDRGHIDCNRHGKGLLALERQVLHCSIASTCPTCAGALVRDCQRCDNPRSQTAAERARDLARHYLADRSAKVGAFIPNPKLVHIRTEHLELTFSLAAMTVGRSKLDTHRLAHLYAQRIEATRTAFLATFQLTDRDFSAPLQVFLFEDRADHRKAAPRFTGAGANGISQKLMGVDAVYCLYRDPNLFRSDAEVHRNVAHMVAHLLLANMKPEIWIGSQPHGWIDAGVAHWFEEQANGLCDNFCYQEVGLTRSIGFNGGKWRSGVRQLVEAGKAKPFAALSKLTTDQLEPLDHALAFGYVDFLIQTAGGKAFRDLVRQVKKQVPTRTAMRLCGQKMLGIDAAFAQWVRREYPLKEGKRR